MFKCTFSKTYDNNIFTKYNIKPVVEDYFKVENNIFCVADGVTRDDVNGNAVIYPETKEQVIDWIKLYPSQSGAYKSAYICCNEFIELVKQYNLNNFDENELKNIVSKINDKIWEINKNREIDYTKEDYYGCVAVGGIIIGNYLYCFSIGDCHIMVLDNECNTIFESINNHKQFEDYLFNIYPKTHTFDWDNSKDRAMVRREYRNNPSKTYNNEPISFGVLTGEKNALHYVDVYKINLDKAKYVCAYSDGCEQHFNDTKTRKSILSNPLELEKHGKERTLVIFENLK